MDTDAALATRLAGGLDRAFPELVVAHQDRLYTIALRLLGDPRDAEEVAQDALVRAYRAMAGYDRDRIVELRLRPWLASITVNLARNRRRRTEDRHPPAQLEPLLSDGFELADEADPGPAGRVTRRESTAALAALLLELPPAPRAAIVLRHIDGLSVAETAVALGRPEGTIKAQVARGLERLRGLVAEREKGGVESRPAAGLGGAGATRADDNRTMQGRALAAEVC